MLTATLRLLNEVAVCELRLLIPVESVEKPTWHIEKFEAVIALSEHNAACGFKYLDATNNPYSRPLVVLTSSSTLTILDKIELLVKYNIFADKVT